MVTALLLTAHAYELIIKNGTDLTKKYNLSYKFIECYLEDLFELNRRRTEQNILPSQMYNTPIDENTFQKKSDKA